MVDVVVAAYITALVFRGTLVLKPYQFDNPTT
jgi:hypothetical protein